MNKYCVIFTDGYKITLYANNNAEAADEAKLMYLEYNDSIAIDKIIYAGQNDDLKVVVNGRAKSSNKQHIDNNIIYVNFRR